MSFQKNKYLVIKKAIGPQLAKFVTQYFLLKRKVARKLFDERYISQFTTEFGVWNDEQVPKTYSHYADIVMETLLTWVQPVMEKHTGYKLSPTYSYARIYKKGDILARHKDRFSCEISTTLNLGGDRWPLYLEPSGQKGKKGIKVDFNPGDMLIYSGCELEHWREAFQGEDCVQVFLHYNKADSKKAKENEFDSRPHLGLPSWFKK
jgi:hypothetical protein